MLPGAAAARPLQRAAPPTSTSVHALPGSALRVPSAARTPRMAGVPLETLGSRYKCAAAAAPLLISSPPPLYSSLASCFSFATRGTAAAEQHCSRPPCLHTTPPVGSPCRAKLPRPQVSTTSRSPPHEQPLSTVEPSCNATSLPNTSATTSLTLVSLCSSPPRPRQQAATAASPRPCFVHGAAGRAPPRRSNHATERSSHVTGASVLGSSPPRP